MHLFYLWGFSMYGLDYGTGNCTWLRPMLPHEYDVYDIDEWYLITWLLLYRRMRPRPGDSVVMNVPWHHTRHAFKREPGPAGWRFIHELICVFHLIVIELSMYCCRSLPWHPARRYYENGTQADMKRQTPNAIKFPRPSSSKMSMQSEPGFRRRT